MSSFDPTAPPTREQPWQETLALRRTLHHPSIPHRWTSRCPYDECGDAEWCSECMTHRTRRDAAAHDPALSPHNREADHD